MAKNKLSSVDKKLIRSLLLFALIQLLIIFAFIQLLINSHTIEIKDTKQIDITVNDIYHCRVPKENWLVIVDDDTKYLFMSRSTSDEYSVSELYDTISTGDRLSLIYYESNSVLLTKANIIVEARTNTEIYRTLEEYNCGKQGVRVFVVILFSVIELVFSGIVIVYICFNYNIIKNIFRNAKKHYCKQIRERL